MGSGERSGSGGGNNWPVIIGGMVGGGAGAAIALLWRPDLGGFWPGLIAFGIFIVVGIVLGQLAGRLLSRPSSGGRPEDKTGTS